MTFLATNERKFARYAVTYILKEHIQVNKRKDYSGWEGIDDLSGMIDS